MNHSQEFALSLHKYRNALKHLLAMNKELVFVNGLICALHPGRYAFSAVKSGSFDSNDFSIRDCIDLDKMIDSKQFDEITVNLSAQEIAASKPYRFSVNVPAIDYVGDYFSEVNKRLEMIDQISSKKSGDSLTFPSSGESHRLCFLEVDNAVLVDMIERVSRTEDFALTFETSKFGLRLFSEKSLASLPFPASLARTIFRLSEPDGRNVGSLQILKSALRALEETTSKIIVADSAFMLVMQNLMVTLLNCYG